MDWKERAGTIAGTAHTQEYLLLHLAMFPIGLHTWCHVLGVPDAPQLQAQIILRAKKVLEYCPITPSASENHHGRDTCKAYGSSPKLLVAPPIGRSVLAPRCPACRRFKVSRVYGRFRCFLRGHSAGSYAGMVWETILAEFSEHRRDAQCWRAIAMPPSLLTRSTLSYSRQVHLIHHADDRLCVCDPVPPGCENCFNNSDFWSHTSLGGEHI